MKLFICLLATTFSLSGISNLKADETDRLLNLSKSDFLQEYENYFISTLELSRELADRMEAGLSDNFDLDTPISDDERNSFSCTYDVFAEANDLNALVVQMQLMDPIREMMENDPSFNYANLVLDEALQKKMAPVDSPAFSRAMSECNMISISTKRLKFSPEFWEKLQQAGKEAGLLNDE